MTASEQHQRDVQPIALIESRRDLIPNKCIWKCGAACFHEAPNENHGRDSFADIVARRLSRRTMLKGMAAATVPFVVAATPFGSKLLEGSPLAPSSAEAVEGTGLGFTPVALHAEDSLVVPEGYSAKVLLRWGDPLFRGVERMTVDNVSARLQEVTFGYNCDLNIFFPLPGNARAGLMAVNHEYSEGARMFTSYDPATATQEHVDVELAAHGMTIVELTRDGEDWGYDVNSHYNRRITGTTPIEITGPASGDDLLKTSYDPDGTWVMGMLNNCAGGRTLWGTVLTAEENFNQYFGNSGSLPEGDPQKELNARYGVPEEASERQWERIYSRFDASLEPREVNRFGYMIEVDPYDPNFVPKKRTALGRFKHEAASVGLADSGRVVVYTGDDERFDYLYKFVSSEKYNSHIRKANFALLDEGTLYVAKFHDDGTGEWIPLDPSRRSELSGWTLAEVCVKTRLAADAVGATPMDRPEDVEINPVTNRVYMVCTNNTNRTPEQVDGPNPRPNNTAGHIIEIDEDGGDLGSTSFTWQIFMLCGDPADPSTYFAGFDKSQVSPIGAPDNINFDAVGNLWIATDGQFNPIKKNDAVFAVPVAGPDRGKLQAFLNSPSGSEVCGPEFSPDFEAFFANIQHPGEGGEGPGDPQSLWPDGTWPALPSMVVVTKNGGGRIGT